MAASAASTLGAFVDFSDLPRFWRLAGFGGGLGISAATLGLAATPAKDLPLGISCKSELGFDACSVPTEPLVVSDKGLADTFTASPAVEVSIEPAAEEIRVRSDRTETVRTALGCGPCVWKASGAAADIDASGASTVLATGVTFETPTPDVVAPRFAVALVTDAGATGAAGVLASTTSSSELSALARADCALSATGGTSAVLGVAGCSAVSLLGR